jgi:hypothetical protein
MVLVGGPILLEVIKERWPIKQKTVFFEITHREWEPVTDSDQRQSVFGKLLNQPAIRRCRVVSNTYAGPVAAVPRRVVTL